MTLLIDDRSGSKELWAYPHIRQIGALCRLESADAAFLGNGPDGEVMVGVELKSVQDLVSSLDNGRLMATQIPAMLDTYDESYLLYYGKVCCSPQDGSLMIGRGKGWIAVSQGKRRVPYSWLMSALETVSGAGVHLRAVATKWDAAAMIAVMYHWRQKQWQDHAGFKTFDRSRKVRESNVRRNGKGKGKGRGKGLIPFVDRATLIRANIAAQLPGVGYDRAIGAAKHFGSITEMVNAGEEEWRKVPKIGKVVASSVVTTLRSKVRQRGGSPRR